MSKYYKQAIEICSQEQDWKAIAIQVAMKNPCAFVQAFKSSGISFTLKEMMLDGRKIEAIKLYREYSGSSLMQAKQYVESL